MAYYDGGMDRYLEAVPDPEQRPSMIPDLADVGEYRRIAREAWNALYDTKHPKPAGVAWFDPDGRLMDAAAVARARRQTEGTSGCTTVAIGRHPQDPKHLREVSVQPPQYAPGKWPPLWVSSCSIERGPSDGDGFRMVREDWAARCPILQEKKDKEGGR